MMQIEDDSDLPTLSEVEGHILSNPYLLTTVSESQQSSENMPSTLTKTQASQEDQTMIDDGDSQLNAKDVATGPMRDAKIAAVRAATGAALNAADVTLSASTISKFKPGAIKNSFLQHRVYNLTNDLTNEQNENQRLRLKQQELQGTAQGLNSQLLETSNLVIELDAERNLLKAQVEELKGMNQIHEQNTKHQGQLIEQTRKKDEFIRHLQDDLNAYKNTIHIATRPAAQISDNDIKPKLDDLFRRIQGFVLRFFKRCTFDHDKVPQPWKKWMIDHVPQENNPARSQTYSVVISVISEILTRTFAPEYHFGMSDETSIQAATNFITSLKPGGCTDMRTWLESTRQQIDRSYPGKLMQAEENLKQHMIDNAKAILAEATNVEWTEALQRKLAEVFVTGRDLFRLLHLQPFAFSVQMLPACIDGQPQMLRTEVMEDTEGVEERAALEGKNIGISVFPLVQKLSKEREDGTETVTIVSKAKVVPIDISIPIPTEIPVENQKKINRKSVARESLQTSEGPSLAFI